MLGTDLCAPGGMTAVVQAYVDGGLMQAWPVRFLATYHRTGLVNKLRSALIALAIFLGWLLTGQVLAVHAHVAARGSFWRKCIFLLLASLAGKPTIFHLHDGSFPQWYAARSKPVRSVVQWLLRRMDRVVVLTESWREKVLVIEPKARLAVLRNPVVVPGHTCQHAGGKILFLARLWPEKGILDLLQAAAIVKARFPDLQVVCAGDGDIQWVGSVANSLGLQGQVSFPGWVDGAAKDRLFESACVFVLPSYFEGLPMGVLEAMARAIPVIATDVGGIPEALGTEAGLTFKPGDVAALAGHISTLLSDASLRRTMGDAGRQRAALLFDRDQVLACLGMLYEELGLERRPVGANDSIRKA